ncbi:tail fiber assembly protein [Morganella morganii]|uniref:tail fiber assembly protein n=1 Tax=Morganella morganii TaxID=582 RepID=UPI0032DB78C7
MSMYVWSPKNNAFFPIQMLDAYSEWDLDDAVAVSNAVVSKFMAQPEPGKIRIAGKSGEPEWADIPPPTKDEMLSLVEAERQRLLTNADFVTADWRTELMLDEISDVDRARLSAWMAYKRSVKAISSVDAIAPGFSWPPLPA